MFETVKEKTKIWHKANLIWVDLSHFMAGINKLSYSLENRNRNRKLNNQIMKTIYITGHANLARTKS